MARFYMYFLWTLRFDMHIDLLCRTYYVHSPQLIGVLRWQKREGRREGLTAIAQFIIGILAEKRAGAADIG